MPMVMGFLIFTYINFLIISIEIKILSFFAIILPISIIQVWIGNNILFKKKSRVDSLVKKMMNCDLRKKHGRDYCINCPEGYNCAKI